MSPENVEIVRRAFEALNEADFDSMGNLLHPDVEWHDQWELPGSTVHRGAEAVLRHFEVTMEDLADLRADLETSEDAPDGRVVASLRISGVGRESGAPVEREASTVFTLRDGKIARGQVFGSRQQALEAVGLRE